MPVHLNLIGIWALMVRFMAVVKAEVATSFFVVDLNPSSTPLETTILPSEEAESVSHVVQRGTGEIPVLLSISGHQERAQISITSESFEFEQSNAQSEFKVGSLRQNISFWSETLKANSFIVESITEGYRIPFFELPENYVIPNRSSAFKFKVFVDEAVSDLL